MHGGSGGGSSGWLARGDDMVEKMEHIADDMASVGFWGRGLKSLGRKSVSVSLSIGKKSLSVVTLGAVGGGPTEPVIKPPRVWVHTDLYDGTTLLGPAACTRISSAQGLSKELQAVAAAFMRAAQEDGDEGGVASARDLVDSTQLASVRHGLAAALSDQVSVCLCPCGVLCVCAACVRAVVSE